MPSDILEKAVVDRRVKEFAPWFRPITGKSKVLSGAHDATAKMVGKVDYLPEKIFKKDFYGRLNPARLFEGFRTIGATLEKAPSGRTLYMPVQAREMAISNAVGKIGKVAIPAALLYALYAKGKKQAPFTKQRTKEGAFMSNKENLLKQAAEHIRSQESVIRTLSSQTEEFKRRIALLEREKTASFVVDSMVDNGMLDSEEKLDKVASLMKLSEEEFKTTQAAVGMISQAPNLGKIKDEDAAMPDDTDPVTKVLFKKIRGEL